MSKPSQYRLDKHRKIHSDEVHPFQICSSEFGSAAYLKLDVTRQHSEQTEETLKLVEALNEMEALEEKEISNLGLIPLYPMTKTNFQYKYFYLNTDILGFHIQKEYKSI